MLTNSGLPSLLDDQPLVPVEIDMTIITSNAPSKSSNILLPATNSVIPHNSTQKTTSNEGLGRITICNSAFDLSPEKSRSKHVINRVYAFAMKDTAGELLPNERVATCMCHRVTRDKEISIKHNGIKGKDGRAKYSNLMRCASIWNCYFCARKLLAERGAEVEQGLKTWIDEMGGSVFMLTLTIPHQKNGDLKKQLELKRQATKRLFDDRVMRKIWALVGKVGVVKALEYTYGKNGHHNHSHSIIFSELDPEEFKKIVVPISKTAKNNHTLLSDKQVQTLIDKGREYRIDYITIEEFIKFYWVKLCREVGLGIASLKHGANITDAQNVKTYLTKLKTAQELTNATAKDGKNGNRNQWQLLNDYMLNDDKEAGYIFKIYAEAFKFESQLNWSRGLKKLLGVPTVEDKKLLQKESPDDIEIVEIFGDVWHLVKIKKLQAHLLNLAEDDFDNDTNNLIMLLDDLRKEVQENRKKQETDEEKERQKNSGQISFKEWQSQQPPPLESDSY